MRNRIKNSHERHDFKVTGGYDPEQDGDEPRWARIAVRCDRCGETRRIGVSVGQVNAMGGCARSGAVEPFREGDYLNRSGALDQFVSILPTGRIVTWNAGGHYHESSRSELVPILAGGLR